MKRINLIALLLMFAFLFCKASAQTEPEPSSRLIDADGISTARSQYLQPPNSATNDQANKILAQMRRRGPDPFPRRGTYPNRQPYQSPWADRDPRRVVLGAAIGFGIGGTIGAVGSIHNHTPVGGGVLIGGSLCALFGGVIASSHVWSLASHHRSVDPSSGPDEGDANRTARARHDADERVALRSVPEAPQSQRSRLADQASLSQPVPLLF